MKIDEIEPGQWYAIKKTAVRRASRQPGADTAFKYIDVGRGPLGDPACPGEVLETGVPYGQRTDGVRVRVHRHTPEDRQSAVLVVHIGAVLKQWDEHELTEDMEARESMLRRADMLEAEARKIREEWGWSS